MIRVLSSRKSVLMLMAVFAVFAFACSESNNPVAPAANDTELVQASANDVRDDVKQFWATVVGDPELIVHGDKQWVRVPVACRHSQAGPDQLAAFYFYGSHMDKAMLLRDEVNFWALTRYAGLDGTDWCPAYRVIKFKMDTPH